MHTPVQLPNQNPGFARGEGCRAVDMTRFRAELGQFRGGVEDLIQKNESGFEPVLAPGHCGRRYSFLGILLAYFAQVKSPA